MLAPVDIADDGIMYDVLFCFGYFDFECSGGEVE